MTKKNKVIFRLLGVFVVLLLVSVCLLGSTFARYTSKDSGTATATIAQWNLTSSGGTVSYTGLSPNMTAYDSTSATNSASTVVTAPTNSTNGVSGYAYGNRYHTTELATVATITNTGAVGAYVKLDDTINEELTYRANNGYVTNNNTIYYDTNNNSSYDNGTDTTTGFSTTIVEDRFSIVVTYTGTQGTGECSDYYYLEPSGGTLTISAYVVWTSYDASPGLSSDDSGEAADKLDTIIGEYVESVKYSFSWTAIQGTEVPAVA